MLAGHLRELRHNRTTVGYREGARMIKHLVLLRWRERADRNGHLKFVSQEKEREMGKKQEKEEQEGKGRENLRHHLDGLVGQRRC
jgi:hypothetical protein